MIGKVGEAYPVCVCVCVCAHTCVWASVPALACDMHEKLY